VSAVKEYCLNKILLCAVVIITMGMISCDTSSGSNAEENRIVSGTVSDGDADHIVIGIFSSDYWFAGDYLGEDDIVEHESAAGWSGEFAPLIIARPEGDGAYNIRLSNDVMAIRAMIAWIDLDGDEKFDLGTEPGYFPIKEIDGTDYAVSFSGFVMKKYSTYLVAYNTAYNRDIDIVGSEGYDFTIHD
jgi:hypothetical protein